MSHFIKNTVKLSVILLMLLVNSAVYAQEEIIPVEDLTDMYNAIKAGELDLLGEKDIHVRSEKTGNIIKADIYAITVNNFDDLYNAVSRPDSWCEFVPLHLNIKCCTYTQRSQPTVTFYAGRKFYESPEDSYKLKYRFEIVKHESGKFRVRLTSEDGPLGTSDYIIIVEALLFENETLLHMGISHKTCFISRAATLGYLSTIGKDKVGFSIVEQKDGNPVYIKGLEGIIERNVMRYFLALSIYLDTLSLVSAERFIQRAEAWYELTEQYATQLHELDKQEYMEVKQKEHKNQERMQMQIDLEIKEHDTFTIENRP